MLPGGECQQSWGGIRQRCRPASVKQGDPAGWSKAMSSQEQRRPDQGCKDPVKHANSQTAGLSRPARDKVGQCQTADGCEQVVEAASVKHGRLHALMWQTWSEATGRQACWGLRDDAPSQNGLCLVQVKFCSAEAPYRNAEQHPFQPIAAGTQH